MGVSSAAARGYMGTIVAKGAAGAGSQDIATMAVYYAGCPRARQSLQMCRRAGGGGERVETGCSVLDLPLVSQLHRKGDLASCLPLWRRL